MQKRKQLNEENKQLIIRQLALLASRMPHIVNPDEHPDFFKRILVIQLEISNTATKELTHDSVFISLEEIFHRAFLLSPKKQSDLKRLFCDVLFPIAHDGGIKHTSKVAKNSKEFDDAILQIPRDKKYKLSYGKK